MMLLLKLGPFHVCKVGHPEQLYHDFTKYVWNFKEFLIATGAKGNHPATYANCGGCKKTKANLKIVGGDKMKS